MLEKFSKVPSTGQQMAVLLNKLSAIGGTGKFEVREMRIRTRLRWHTKPKTAIRHMLQGEQRPDIEEAREIEAGHLKYCAEQIKANNNENVRLFESMRAALVAMQTTDPDFFRPHVEAVRELLFQPGNMGGGEGKADGGSP